MKKLPVNYSKNLIGNKTHNSQPKVNNMSLKEEIQIAINRSNAEAKSDTPDFILAEYLTDCLKAFDTAVTAREKWYGRGEQTVEIPFVHNGQEFTATCEQP